MDNEPFVAFGGELLSLAERIKEDLPVCASMYNTLMVHARDVCSSYTFYVLRDHPLSHVILWCDEERTEVSLHCRESEVELVKATMKQSSLVEWKSMYEFAHVPVYLIDALQEVARHKTGFYLDQTKCFLFTYEPPLQDEPLRCKPGLRVCRLGRAGVRLMLNSSKFDKHRPIDATLALAQKVASAGIYEDPEVESETEIDVESLPDGGDVQTPLAWISTMFYGGLAALHTEEEYRGRGFGSLVTQVAAKMLRSRGYIPHVYVEVQNDVSFKMFSKLKGWRQTARISWLNQPFLEPVDDETGVANGE